MTKHNLTWYNNRIAEAQQALTDLQNTIEAARKAVENGLSASLIDWVAMYDAESELEDSIKSLERRRDTRNWNHQDWALHSLVMQNID